MFYLVDNGIKWRALPADFPPWQTVYGMFARWKDDGVLGRHHRPAARRRPRRRRPRSRAVRRVHRLAVRARIRRGRRPDRDQRLRPAQESQRPQAPHPDRHPRPAHRGRRHPGQRPGPDARRRLLPQRARRRGRHRLALVWADNGYHGDAWIALDHARSSTSPSRSSTAAPRARDTDSRSCPAAGSSSAPTPGSAAADAAPATTSDSPPTTPPWSTAPPSSRWPQRSTILRPRTRLLPLWSLIKQSRHCRGKKVSEMPRCGSAPARRCHCGSTVKCHGLAT